MTQHNPIYQALVRSGGMQNLMREFERSAGTKALFDRFRNEMSFIGNLSDRGIITPEMKYEISKKAARSIHAAAIRHWRSHARLIDRRRMPSQLREAGDQRGRSL